MNPRVPRRAKVVVALAGLWLLSPIDLLPEFLPVIARWMTRWWSRALALRHAARRVPRELLVEAWPGEAWLLERLLGGPVPATGYRLAPGVDVSADCRASEAAKKGARSDQLRR
jgi:hypothetical protein